MATITEIRTQRHGSKRRQLFVDGELWRCVSSEVVAAAELHEGDDVEPASLREAIAELEPRFAKERALRLLSFKDRSRAGLIERLTDDGYPQEVAEGVVADLQRMGFVDDDRFAAAYARTLVEIKRFGRSRVLRELERAGIEDSVAAGAVAEALPEETEDLAALVIARSAACRSGSSVDKVASRLMRRGYRPGIALNAARAAFDELRDGACEGTGDDWGGA